MVKNEGSTATPIMEEYLSVCQISESPEVVMKECLSVCQSSQSPEVVIRNTTKICGRVGTDLNLWDQFSCQGVPALKFVVRVLQCVIPVF